MGTPDTEREARLQREIEHHRRIAARAEAVWNWDSPAGQRRADRRAALFVEHGDLRPGRRALELGCGTGVFLERVAPCGAEIRGLDLSEDLLERARTRLARFSNVGLDRGDAEELPYPVDHFDAVYGSSVLHHLDLDRALRAAFRVSKPGGRVVFAEPNSFNPQVYVMFNFESAKERFGVSPDERAFSRFHAHRALRAAGFTDVEVRPFDFLHPSTPLRWLDGVARLGRGLEHTPLLKEIAGSLLLTARKP
jgi:SAM-dependent methyltransferase